MDRSLLGRIGLAAGLPPLLATAAHPPIKPVIRGSVRALQAFLGGGEEPHATAGPLTIDAAATDQLSGLAEVIRVSLDVAGVAVTLHRTAEDGLVVVAATGAINDLVASDRGAPASELPDRILAGATEAHHSQEPVTVPVTDGRHMAESDAVLWLPLTAEGHPAGALGLGFSGAASSRQIDAGIEVARHVSELLGHWTRRGPSDASAPEPGPPPADPDETTPRTADPGSPEPEVSVASDHLRAFSENIVQGVQEGIVVTTPDGTIDFANRSFERMLGYAPGRLVGMRWRTLVPPAWRNRLPEPGLDGGRYESRLLTREGDEVAVQVSIQPRAPEGDTSESGSLVVFTDITERVRAETVARALGEAGLALQTAEDRADIYATLSSQASRTGLRVIVALFDDQQSRLQVPFHSLSPRGVGAVERALGFDFAELEIPLAVAAPVQRLLSDRRPVFAADGAALVRPLLPRRGQALAGGIAERLGIGPSMHVPMILSSRPIGVVTVTHPELSERDRDQATVFANQVATALDRARLHDETRERQRKIAVLAETAQHLAASADLTTLAQGVTEQACRVFHSDAAGLYIYDTSRDALELAAAPGLTAEERQVAESTAWARHPGWVIRHRQALLSGDSSQDPRVVYIGSRPRFSSVMYVPLLIEDSTCIGAMCVAARRPYAHQPADLRLLTTLADQVAVAVANALRVRDAGRRAEQLERVSLAGQRIASHLRVSDVLDRAVAEVASVFEVTHASVYLTEQGHIEAAHHYPADEPLFDPTSGSLAWLATNDRPMAIADLRDTEALPGLKLSLIEKGVHSVLLVPVVHKDRVVGGILLFARENRRSFTGPSQELARIVAGQLAVAVDNARLYQATNDARQRVEAVVQSAFTSILTVDTVGRLRDANPAAERMLAESTAKLNGRLLDDVLGIDLWLDPDGPIARARRTRSMVAPVERVLPETPSRDAQEVLLGVAPLPDGYLISMADITRLKELDRLKSELVANVSHELRSPLASIKAYTELLLDGLVPDENTYAEFLTVIDSQADRLGQCIGNLLDLARVESEGYRVQPERFSLNGFIEDVVDTVKARAQHRGVEINASFPERDTMLLGDRGILFSLLKNLLDNAVKYSDTGQTVDLEVTVGMDGLEMTVIDRGPGIASEELPRIFEKFYRVPSSNPTGIEGSGLGLVIARQAARAHGGDIRVTSEVGAGSRFTVHLPASIFDDAGLAGPVTEPISGRNGETHVERLDPLAADRRRRTTH